MTVQTLMRKTSNLLSGQAIPLSLYCVLKKCRINGLKYNIANDASSVFNYRRKKSIPNAKHRKNHAPAWFFNDIAHLTKSSLYDSNNASFPTH